MSLLLEGNQIPKNHAHALKLFCYKYPETVLIHAGTRFVVQLFNELPNRQYYCLLGAEGYKLEKALPKLNLNKLNAFLDLHHEKWEQFARIYNCT